MKLLLLVLFFSLASCASDFSRIRLGMDKREVGKILGKPETKIKYIDATRKDKWEFYEEWGYLNYSWIGLVLSPNKNLYFQKDILVKME